MVRASSVLSPAGQALFACCLVALLAACRKLPGPSECQRVAVALLELEEQSALSEPRVRDEFDRLTRECLLTPYDRELVRCIDETQRARPCWFQFQRRYESTLSERVADEDSGSVAPVRRW